MEVEPFNIVKIFEPTSNATMPNQYIALVGGVKRSINIFQTSTLSPTSAVFTNCNPPGAEFILDKNIYRVTEKFVQLPSHLINRSPDNVLTPILNYCPEARFPVLEHSLQNIISNFG